MQELLQAIPRGQFAQQVQRIEADKHSKGFNSWNQLVVMLYAQFSGAGSLRQIETGFNSQFTHHYHLGCRAVHRSTLAEANTRRNHQVFADLARLLMAQLRGQRQVRREAQALVQLLDSTSISLKGQGFDEWAQPHRTCHTQGLKVHVLYDLVEQAPCRVSLGQCPL